MDLSFGAVFLDVFLLRLVRASVTSIFNYFIFFFQEYSPQKCIIFSLFSRFMDANVNKLDGNAQMNY